MDRAPVDDDRLAGITADAVTTTAKPDRITETKGTKGSKGSAHGVLCRGSPSDAAKVSRLPIKCKRLFPQVDATPTNHHKGNVIQLRPGTESDATRVSHDAKQVLSNGRVARVHLLGPARWTEALDGYVSGRLPSLAAVARHLDVDRSTVGRRAASEQWTKLRAENVAKVRAQIEAGSGVSSGREAPMGSAPSSPRTELETHASQALGECDSILSDLSALRARLAGLTLTDPQADGLIARIRCLSDLHSELAETARMLAGIPHPDRIRTKPDTAKPDTAKPEPAPSLGRVPTGTML